MHWTFLLLKFYVMFVYKYVCKQANQKWTFADSYLASTCRSRYLFFSFIIRFLKLKKKQKTMSVTKIKRERKTEMDRPEQD